MGSLEDLFFRHEQEFDTIKDEKGFLDWLSGTGTPNQRNSNSYKNVAKKFAEPYKLEEDAMSADEPEEMRTIISNFKKMDIRPDSVKSTINSRLRELQKEERQIVREQEMEIAEKLASDKKALQEQFRRGQLDEESRKEAEELLSERSVAQLERFERERTARAFAGLQL